MEYLFEIGLSNALMATVLAVVAALVGLVCRRRPALVHALWLLVLIKLVTPPLVPFRVSAPTSAATAPESPVPQKPVSDPETRPSEEEASSEDAEAPWLPAEDETGTEAEEPPAEEPLPSPALDMGAARPGRAAWIHAIAGVWFIGSLAWFSLAGRRVWRFSRALRHARPAPADLQTRVSELAKRVGLHHSPLVLLVPGRVAPMVWCLGRLMLLVPQGLHDSLGPAGLDTLLIHELAHIRRRDHLVRWLEFLALGLFWWNPVAWYARRELHEAEEQCCDAWVVRTLPGSSRTYATALVDALDFLCDDQPALPALASGLGQVADVKRRLTMILRGSTPHGLGRISGLVVAGLALLLVPVMPSLGQTQQGAEPEKNPEARRVLQARVVLEEADLKKMEAEIAKKVAELADLKAKMEQLQKDAVKRQLAAAKRTREEAMRAFGVLTGKTAVIRIEISGLALNAEELKKLADTLEKSLPGKEKRVTIVVSGAKGAAIPGMQPLPAVPRPPVVGRPVLPAGPGFKVIGPHSDKRMDGLEKKLDLLLRELESLRKEIRGRKGGSALPPGSPPGGAPPAGGGGPATPAKR